MLELLWTKGSLRERLKAGGQRDDREWVDWMASLTQWTWVVQALGDGEGQGSLVCWSTWSNKESYMTEWLNNRNKKLFFFSDYFCTFISSVQSLRRVRLFATPWIAACQASLSIINSRSSLRLTSIKTVMPSSHLIFCRPLLLLPPIPPSIRVFSNESTLRMRWPKSWICSFSIIPSKEIPGLISLLFKGLSRVFSNTTVQKHQFFGAKPSSQSNSHIHTWSQEKP